MQIEGLSWFPGHMTKTKRMIVSEIGHMDAVCEIVDARIPQSSRNPDVDELTAGKPRLMVLNRVDQADPAETKKWAAAFRAQGFAVLEANARGGVGTEKFAAAVRELLKDKLAAYAEKGQGPHHPRDGAGHPQRGKIHVYQQGGQAQDCQSRGPAGCHPLQAVGAGGRHAGAVGYAGDSVAKV